MNSAIFSPRMLILLIGIGTFAFLAVVYREVFGIADEVNTVDPSAFSNSAIGHRAFLELLRELKIPVAVSRFKTADKVGPDDLLIVAEPNPSVTGVPALIKSLTTYPNALLVLPKWRGIPDRSHPRWISDRVLAATSGDVLKEIAPGSSTWRSTAASKKWSLPGLPGQIVIDRPQMLSSKLRMVFRGPEGGGDVFVAELMTGNNRLWVLSDPDLISNEGMDEGDNAAVAVALIQRLLPPGGKVVIDEVSHGFELEPNLRRAFLAPPYVIVTISSLLAALFWVWSGAVRFGAAIPEAPVLALGKRTLIRTAGDILGFGAGPAALLARYRRVILGDAVAELNGPRGLTERQQVDWLDRTAAARGLGRRLSPLLAEIDLAAPDNKRARQLALDLYLWKQEMLHGTGGNPGAG